MAVALISFRAIVLDHYWIFDDVEHLLTDHHQERLGLLVLALHEKRLMMVTTATAAMTVSRITKRSRRDSLKCLDVMEEYLISTMDANSVNAQGDRYEGLHRRI